MNMVIEREWNGTEVKIRGKKVTQRSAYEIGLIVEGQARALCPIDTGRLSGSITTQSKTNGTNPRPPAGTTDVIQKPSSDNEVLVGTAVGYGPYQEFGTIRNQAQPFLRPSLDLAMGRALTIVKDEGRYQFKEYLK